MSSLVQSFVVAFVVVSEFKSGLTCSSFCSNSSGKMSFIVMTFVASEEDEEEEDEDVREEDEGVCESFEGVAGDDDSNS